MHFLAEYEPDLATKAEAHCPALIKVSSSKFWDFHKRISAHGNGFAMGWYSVFGQPGTEAD